MVVKQEEAGSSSVLLPGLFESCSSAATWRLSAERIEKLRSVANAIGAHRCAQTETVEPPPPRFLLKMDDAALDAELARLGAPTSLTAAEETRLKRWYEAQMQKLCGRAPVGSTSRSRLRRSDKVTTTAVLLYKRFYLSHSVLECEPMAMALAALFVAAKVEDEFLSASEIASETSDDVDAAEKLQAQIFQAERSLLVGVGFDLRCANAYRPLAALFEETAETFSLPRSPALDAFRRAALDHLDAAVLTDATLTSTPTVIALASLRAALVAQNFAHITVEAFDAHAASRLGDAALNAAKELVLLPNTDDTEAEAADLKKLRKRLKKAALWSTAASKQPAAKKRPKIE